MISVPVLMYHHVLPEESFIVSSVSNFEKQMKMLADEGWKTLTSKEFFLYKKGELKIPKKSVLITFDDGWRDNFIYAYPILKKYNLKATIFVVAQWIEKASLDKNYDYCNAKHNKCKRIVPLEPRKVLCTWDELISMSDIFNIHCHTYTHRDKYFNDISWEEEFAKSKVLIEKRLGFKDEYFCWPRGHYTKELISKAQKENFNMLFTTKRGVNLPDNNLLEIKRISVKKDDKWLRKNLFIFANSLMGKIYSRIKPE